MNCAYDQVSVPYGEFAEVGDLKITQNLLRARAQRTYSNAPVGVTYRGTTVSPTTGTTSFQ